MSKTSKTRRRRKPGNREEERVAGEPSVETVDHSGFPRWLTVAGESAMLLWVLYVFFVYYQENNFFGFIKEMLSG